MKEKILIWLSDNSYLIIQCLFYPCALVVLVLNLFFANIDIGIGNKIIAYLFWLLLGMYLGYAVALRARKYMHQKGRRFTQWKNKEND